MTTALPPRLFFLLLAPFFAKRAFVVVSHLRAISFCRRGLWFCRNVGLAELLSPCLSSVTFSTVGRNVLRGTAFGLASEEIAVVRILHPKICHNVAAHPRELRISPLPACPRLAARSTTTRLHCHPRPASCGVSGNIPMEDITATPPLKKHKRSCCHPLRRRVSRRKERRRRGEFGFCLAKKKSARALPLFLLLILRLRQPLWVCFFQHFL